MPESGVLSSPFSIIIPVHNEAGGLPHVLRAVKETAPEAEIIVVDDGSTDGTADVARREGGERARVVRHEEKLGYGAALKTGIRAASHERIAIVDGDGTYPVDRIPELVERLRDADMVVGARVGPGTAIPLLRRPAKWLLNKLANYLAQRRIPDINSGLRAMRKEAVAPYANILPDGFSFTTTITLAMTVDGRRVDYVPVSYHPRHGRSKIRPLRDTANFVQLILRTILYFAPLRVFGPISLICFAASLGFLIFGLTQEDIMDGTISVFFVAGMQFLGIGMVADLVNRRMR
ncbi:MAG: glycosyltransferase family 2 protein [Candidatus Sumerlaeota bacterium]|nr:glycosyltransferase family 2 protein [Candidatus Sumerlaeota bacterium]